MDRSVAEPSWPWDRRLRGRSLRPRDLLLGRYELLDVLGRGGIGEVYRALDQRLMCEVAIKTLHGGRAVDGTALVRLECEARAMGALSHPNIVGILDVRMDHDPPLLVMEYVPGLNLAEVLRRGRPPWPWIVAAMHELLEALAAVHRGGVVHRDLKPSNCQCVDFTSYADPPRIKLLDFGIARFNTHSATITQTGVVVGTANYLSPEQARSWPVDARTDLYAAGAMLFEMLNGAAPYQGTSVVDVMLQHVHEPVPQVHAAESLPELQLVVTRALAKTADHRYQTAEEFARALAELPASLPDRDAGSSTRLASARMGANATTLHGGSGLQALLQRVQRQWVDNVLARVDIAAGLLSPRHKLAPDLVEKPLEASADEPLPIAGDEPLPALFERLDRSLLLTGVPGSGKSVAVVVLARYLAGRAARSRTNGAEPIPVVFSLTSWGPCHSDLAAWIVDELRTQYQVPAQLAVEWVREGRIVPLFDGLDESEDPAGAVAAINRYLAGKRPTAVVVACDLDVCCTLSERLALNAALHLQPLTIAQVCTTARDQGAPAGLEEALERDPQLMSLARSPLMLNLIHRIAADEGLVNLAHDEGDGLVSRVYYQYLEAVSHRRIGSEQMPFAALKAPLARLASRMLHRGQSIFRFENLQPSWLPTGRWRALYFVLTRTLAALLFALGFVPAVAYSPLENAGLRTDMAFALRLSLSFALASGLTQALASHGLATRTKPSLAAFRFTTISAALTAGALSGTWLAFTVHPVGGVMGLELGFFSIFLFTFGRRADTFDHDVVTMDAVRWRWRLLRRRLHWIFAIMVAVAAVEGLVEGSWIAGGALGSAFGILGLLVGGLGGAVPRRVDAPNSGLRITMEKAMIAGVTAFTAGTLVFAGLYGPHYGLCVGLAFATFASLRFGGYDLLCHLVLRLLLDRCGELPLNLSSVLASATRVSLMRQLGGGYMFTHRSLQQFLAGSGALLVLVLVTMSLGCSTMPRAGRAGGVADTPQDAGRCGSGYASRFEEILLPEVTGTQAQAGEPRGNFGSPMGLAVADMDGDGHLDLVVVSGNDQQAVSSSSRDGRGHAGVLYGPFLRGRASETWVSDHRAYNRRVVVGNLDEDGRPDIAVAVLNPEGAAAQRTTNVDIYLSAGQTRRYQRLEGVWSPKEKSMPLADATSVALADVDDDGDLDIAVTQAYLNQGSAGAAPQYILDNRTTGAATRFAEKLWQSSDRVVALQSRFSDLNGDGLLDFALTSYDPNDSSEWARIYWGCPRRAALTDPPCRGAQNSSWLSRTGVVQNMPTGYPCQSGAAQCATYGLDFAIGHDTAHDGPFIVAGFNQERCWEFYSKSPHPELICRAPSHLTSGEDHGLGVIERYVQWYRYPSMTAVVALIDGDEDGLLDLLSADWRLDAATKPMHAPGPLLLYCGANAPDPFSAPPMQLGDRELSYQALALADLGRQHEGVEEVRVGPVEPGRVGHVFLLPCCHPSAVEHATKNGRQLESGRDYQLLPNSGLISFNEPVSSADRVEIRLRCARAVDILVADEHHDDRIFLLRRHPAKEPHRFSNN